MDCSLKVKSFEHLVFECTSNLLTCKLGGGRTMKRIIIILSISFSLILAGVLYGKLIQPDRVGTIDNMGAELVYMDQFPDPIPDFVIY